jgi:chromosome partitioning protein
VIIVIGGIKGGAGKSTIAVNLAVARAGKHKVLLVDGDQQKTTTKWLRQRDTEYPNRSPNLSYLRVLGATARDEIAKAAKKHDDTIVDVGGMDSTTQRAALSVADLLLIPVQPRSADLWALEEVCTVINDVLSINPKLKNGAFINRAFAKGSDNNDAMQLIDETSGIDLIPLKIGDRKAFSNSFGEGLTVPEIQPIDRKAVEELQSLYLHCFHSV